MVFTILNFNWKAIFNYDINTNFNKPLQSKIESASFGNDDVKFILSAITDNENVTFFIKLDPKSVIQKIVCTTKCHLDKSKIILTFNNVVKYSNFLKQEINHQEKLLISEKWENVFSKDLKNCDGCSCFANINLRIKFLNENVSSFSNTWISFGDLNTVNQAETLCEQLTSLKENSTLADVTIVADGKEFKVHSVVLAMRSPVFAAMFSDEGHFKESKEKKVKIEDIDSQVMETFIAFLYGQKNTKWKSIASDLVKVADKYDVQPLHAICAVSLAADVTVEIAAKNFQCAHQFGITDSMREIAQFISKNKAAVKATDGWKEYVLSNVNVLETLYEMTP